MGKLKILLTGFLPFGGNTINPSQLIVESLEYSHPCVELHKVILPVSFLQSKKQVEELMEVLRPDAVISIGQSGGRGEINIERIAVNLNDAVKPDNDGDIPFERKIYEDGANAYFATVPVKKIVQNIKDAGIPAALSNSAGLHVCNNVMYTVLHNVAARHIPVVAGFIHVPYLPQQAALMDKKPSMNLQDMIAAVRIAIDTVVCELSSLKPNFPIV